MRWLKRIIEAVITWCREFYRGIRKKYGISEGDGRSLRSPRDLPAEEEDRESDPAAAGPSAAISYSVAGYRASASAISPSTRPTPRA